MFQNETPKTKKIISTPMTAGQAPRMKALAPSSLTSSESCRIISTPPSNGNGIATANAAIIDVDNTIVDVDADNTAVVVHYFCNYILQERLQIIIDTCCMPCE